MCRKITSHWQPLFSKKMAAASFSYKIDGGGMDLATLLAAVLTWSGYWETNIKHGYSLLVCEARGAILNPGAQISKAGAEFMPLGAQY